MTGDQTQPAASSSPGQGPACVPLDAVPGGGVDNAPVLDRDFPWDREDPVVSSDFELAELISGGPPPDGIRPIDAPCFDTVAGAEEWLEPNSPVMVVEVDDDTRLYPLAILTAHEIVNDVIGGEPVVVTYCPLCNSGLAFERTVEGQVLDFGTSGRLYRSNLVMYDRQTKSLWTQFLGQAVVGEDFVGTELTRLTTSLLAWADAAAASPDALVLARDSVPGREYGRNPYPGYEGSGDGFLFQGPRDDRLSPNDRVVGVGDGDTAVAIPLARLREERVVPLDVDGERLTVWWAPGQSSALDSSVIDEGVDVGSTAVFRTRLADGTELTFAAGEGSAFVDQQTGTTWNLLGQATAGPLAGSRLDGVPHDDTFWFVWFAFQPETSVADQPLDPAEDL